jgi:hypothetical protein
MCEKGGTMVYVRMDFNDFLRLPVDQPPAIPDGPLPAELSEIVPEAGMLPGEALVTKRHHGAFARTELESLLKAAWRGDRCDLRRFNQRRCVVDSAAGHGAGLRLRSGGRFLRCYGGGGA